MCRIIVDQSPGATACPSRRGRVNSMPPRLNGTLFAAALSILPVPTYAQVAGPFAGLVGSWTGGGVAALASGTKENLRCRAAYKVGNGGRTLQLSIRCVSNSYNFYLTGSVVDPDGTISGTLTESGHNVAGTMSGRASGGTIQAVAPGGCLSAGV